ncbi:hypothetical protein KC19_VG031000 [Ceratodon purpureus]|uniref:Uncharacterized protein n=1 Tax=Ceratodon purpureus TaxID=3225 RepID=A0A8T0HLF5_CERPU|nr:hypothetical protein KC19_VG031000 [Ceratodon purpureus]
MVWYNRIIIRYKRVIIITCSIIVPICSTIVSFFDRWLGWSIFSVLSLGATYSTTLCAFKGRNWYDGVYFEFSPFLIFNLHLSARHRRTRGRHQVRFLFVHNIAFTFKEPGPRR